MVRQKSRSERKERGAVKRGREIPCSSHTRCRRKRVMCIWSPESMPTQGPTWYSHCPGITCSPTRNIRKWGDTHRSRALGVREGYTSRQSQIGRGRRRV